jgi:ABC-type multidrug transport system fused ATPase/permease subunit
MSATSPKQPKPGIQTWALNWQIIRYQPGTFIIHSIYTICDFSLWVVPGWVFKMVFDTISGESAAGSGTFLGISILWWWIALYGGTEMARVFLSLGAEWYGWTFRFVVSSLLRRNLFASILRRKGDSPLPVSSGETSWVNGPPQWLPS